VIKSDSQLKQDVEDELFWDPSINAARISVTVLGGAVTLRGSVDTFAQKCAAEHATKRVGGVRSVAQELAVDLLSRHQRSDGLLALAAQGALEWDVVVPDQVTATVHEGAITLAGHVTWNFQREAAKRAVHRLAGVVAVRDEITLDAQPGAQVRQKFLAAMERQSNQDPSAIRLGNCAGRVTLSGRATSWQAIEDAEGAAWSTGGVSELIDEIELDVQVRSASDARKAV
jgi:osmotically-inducible protein OsmY